MTTDEQRLAASRAAHLANQREPLRTSARVSVRSALFEQSQGASSPAVRRRAAAALACLEGRDAPKPEVSAPKRPASTDLSTEAGRRAALATLPPEIARHVRIAEPVARTHIDPNSGRLTLHAGVANPHQAASFKADVKGIVDGIASRHPEIARAIDPGASPGTGVKFDRGRLTLGV